MCCRFYLLCLETTVENKSCDDVSVQQNNTVTCLSQKPSNQRPLHCTDMLVTKTYQRPAVYRLYYHFPGLHSFCLCARMSEADVHFVTLNCCIDYKIMIDCNGQAIVLVSAIKMQTSFCSHSQTCIFVFQWMRICSRCVHVCLYRMDPLGWKRRAWCLRYLLESSRNLKGRSSKHFL